MLRQFSLRKVIGLLVVVNIAYVLFAVIKDSYGIASSPVQTSSYVNRDIIDQRMLVFEKSPGKIASTGSFFVGDKIRDFDVKSPGKIASTGSFFVGDKIRDFDVKSPGKIASTGSLFVGDKIRHFGYDRREFKFTTQQGVPSVSSAGQGRPPGERQCTKWAVVTTIHEPSESVRRMLYLINRPNADWCMVIVGDLKLPISYEIMSTMAKHKNVVYIDGKQQMELFHNKSNSGVNFVHSLPWQSFGRKNVGFAFALSQTPRPSFIWDFDDDNQFKFWLDHANVKNFQSIDYVISVLSGSDSVEVVSVNSSYYRHSLQYPENTLNPPKEPVEKEHEPDLAFNPYPFLGCQLTKCWPRGFPLSLVEQTLFSATGQRLESYLLPAHPVKSESISIVQSLADHKPDVDAIFRMTVSNRPFSFVQKGDKIIDKLLVIPRGLVVPMNAQATLHARSAFFGLYLPWTVNGRVSDIWRSYVVEALLSLTDHAVAFAPLPMVDQDRNTDHGPMADYDAEHQLNLQTDALIARLSDWKSKQYKIFFTSEASKELAPANYFTHNMAALMEDLYIDLYERQFVEEGDVISVQFWLQLLTCYGYLYSEQVEKNYNSNNNIDDNSKYNQAVKCESPSVGVQPVISPDKLKHFAKIGNSEDDYTISTCPPVSSNNHLIPTERSKLTFLSADWHPASRFDIPTLLASLGHKIIVAGPNGIHGRKTHYPDTFTRKYSVSRTNLISDVSDMVINWTTRTGSVYLKHLPDGKNNFFTKTVDGQNLIDRSDVLLSCFPPNMFNLWKSFLLPEPTASNVSLIMAPAHRYNLGFCSRKDWTQLNDDITALLTSPSHRHVAGCMSRYDLEYMHHYTGFNKLPNGYTSHNNKHDSLSRRDEIPLHLLPAMSFFYTKPEVGRENGNVKKRKTLVFFNLWSAPRKLSESLKAHFLPLRERGVIGIDIKKLHKRYELSDLLQYGAILYYPYSVMAYKFVEFYSLNIPLMVPSLKFFKDQAPFGDDRTICGRLFCGANETIALEMNKAPNSAHQYNPNIRSDSKLDIHLSDKRQHELYWLQFADFYDYPHVTYFDNASHAGDLFIKHAIEDNGRYFLNIRKLMEEENNIRRYFAIEKTWCPLLDDLSQSFSVDR